ncbi:zinc finger protein, putative [Plasmodium berghei]|uniref:Zinc finger protein, putative n=2 Tax=Plasmodium berghei TaxID=5821 RepID=A0A509AIC8_PLABA|nr:zinc finger protein, putative [Plasmodium berghei ANKA]SCL92107.1 zinc finger protein, putative [Plasmodium berghei]SCM15596.1 zinc finger protein, putative [Plasmodium berghei]SCN22649.1 zinc finger protein, putative [Plasmodium berghei]VUC54361.1 zinc finger protein, putative [Plasmodium berghei ANKA]|eukprot:XP_034420194.1 zinc finger protein, putative [Plasmodium berghei ANKA]
MNTFPSNATNYRNRTLNSSGKNTNINYKINSYINKNWIFCPACSLPFNTKLRINPCYHIVCGKCYEISLQKNQSCIICNSEINDVDFIFQNDNIYICPYDFCKKGYLNLKSYNYHIYFKHEFLKEHGQDYELNCHKENNNLFPMNNEFVKDYFVNYVNATELENKTATDFANNLNNIKNNSFLIKNNTTNKTSSENIQTNINNKMNMPFINSKVNVPDNWNFTSMPFRSNFNLYSNEKYNTNNVNTKKNNEPQEEDDYDNLEDLM